MTWLVSDLCIGLYSSALFEAEFLGAKVFTPLRDDDDFYLPVMLERLCHPVPGQRWLDALRAFLIAGPQTPPEPLPVKGARRARQLAELNNNAPSA